MLARSTSIMDCMLTIQCPISLAPIKIPVITNNGITYEFEEIARHLLSGNITDPVTRGEITTIILNRVILDPVLTLSSLEKNMLATYQAKLAIKWPSISIHGLESFEGMQHFAWIDEMPPLYMAAVSNDIELVQRLLDCGVDPNQATIGDGATALHFAAWHGCVEIVQILLQAPGINRNQTMIANGATPFYAAVAANRSAVVDVFLNTPGIHINQARTDEGSNPLCIAAVCGHTGIVQRLLNTPTLDSDHTWNEGDVTILRLAADHGQSEVVSIFLDYYFNRLINQPERMRCQFEQTPSLVTELIKYRTPLWQRLKQLRNTKRERFLTEILAIEHSSHQTDADLRHPLYYIFTEEKMADRYTQLFFNKRLTIMQQISKILATANSIETGHSL